LGKQVDGCEEDEQVEETGGEVKGKGEGPGGEMEVAGPPPKKRKTAAKSKAKAVVAQESQPSGTSAHGKRRGKRALQDDDDDVGDATPPPAVKKTRRPRAAKAMTSNGEGVEAVGEGGPSSGSKDAPKEPTAKACAKVKGKGKGKGKASSRSSRKVHGDGEAEEAKEATPTATPKSKAAAKPAPKRRGRVPRKVTEEAEGVGEDLADNLPDPDNFREEATKAVLQCLHDCKAAGTLGTKCKHAHNTMQLDLQDDLGNDHYWKRGAAGVKIKATNSQICYFSRSSPCNGTNIALLHFWVLWQKNNIYSLSMSMGNFICAHNIKYHEELHV